MKLLLAVLMLILLGLQFRLWAGEGSFAEISRLSEEVARQSTENEALRERNEALYREVDALKNSMDAIEERARNELGLIKEGETFYLIVDGEKAPE